MKTLDSIANINEAVSEAMKRSADLQDRISFVCLWECYRLGVTPLTRESCFGSGVMTLLQACGQIPRLEEND